MFVNSIFISLYLTYPEQKDKLTNFAHFFLRHGVVGAVEIITDDDDELMNSHGSLNIL